MPDFQYWWTMSAFVVAAGTVFSLTVGIVGVKTIVSRRVYWALWGLSVIVAAGGWYASANQASDGARDRLELLSSMNRADPKPPVALPTDAPAWLAIAYKEIGQGEVGGIEENPRIIEYFQALRDGKAYRDDRDDWSSPFVEWSLQQAGKSGPHSIKPNDWLGWGRLLKSPVAGAIVILSFSGLQHVGFYFGEDSDFVRVLGGNQNDAVNVYRYPKTAVRGYRSP
jgi:uncharacterized protein (TIGR02594 family)